MSSLSPRAATVPLVDPEAATGKVRAIFDDIRATKKIDFVPNFWRVLANHPDQLELVWNQLKTLMHPEAVGRTSSLDARTRETIALAVSAANGCPYCVESHTAALKKLGLDPKGVSEILAIVGLFAMTNALAHGFQVAPDVRAEWS